MSLVCVFLAGERNGERELGIPGQGAVSAPRGLDDGQRLHLRAGHHLDVLHPVLRDLHLLHVPEEVQDQPLLPHHGEC